MSAQDVPVLSEDVARNHEYVHGAAGTYVETENGLVPSLATQVEQNNAAINESGLLAEVNAGVAAAQEAASAAQVAAVQSGNNLTAAQEAQSKAAESAEQAHQIAEQFGDLQHAVEEAQAAQADLQRQIDELREIIDGGGGSDALYWQDDETGELIVDDDGTQIEGL